MARIYFSYREADQEIVDTLVRLLKAKGHEIDSDRHVYVGSEWRKQQMETLLRSDAVVMIWSKNTVGSQYVPAEAGMVRTTPRIALLPVLVGALSSVPSPYFIRDLKAARLAGRSQPEQLAELADKLDASVQRHLEYVGRRDERWPAIFVSHRHKDEPVARALIDCLEASFQIAIADLRCTSVQPYRLPVGTDTADRLREEISHAEVVLGILSPDTQASSYVLFELGFAWGQQVWTCPLLVRGADHDSIPDPIRGRSALSLANPVDCHQLLDDLKRHTTLTPRAPAGGEIADLVQRLVRAATAAT